VTKKRLDTLLVARGLSQSRNQAQALILAGEVSVGGNAALKPGSLIPEDAAIALAQPPPYVSRGGFKLEHALDTFNIKVSDLAAADIGASTGGFTDCLLQRGARRVYAVDVGYGQLDYRLRRDPRVVSLERVNARYPFELPEKVDLATVDLSFISLEKVLPTIAGLLKEGGPVIALVKPQFEARRDEVGKGGIVKDPAVHARVLGRFIAWSVGQGFRLGGLAASPILGASGNREFLALLRLT